MTSIPCRQPTSPIHSGRSKSLRDTPVFYAPSIRSGSCVGAAEYVCSSKKIASMGPAIFVGGWALEQLWLFWIAPILGAVAAWLTHRALLEGLFVEPPITGRPD